MTSRDRLIFLGIGLLAVLGAAWVLAVSPVRNQASKVSAEVTSTRSQLSQAQREAAEARNARARYHSAYASLVQLGQAVPTSPEVPALVYALDKASDNHKVEFGSIISSSASSGTSSSSSSSSSSSAAAATAPFTQMPFTFTFNGSYDGLIHLLGQLERFTVQVPGSQVEVSGRLLTIQSVALAASSTGGSAAASATQSAQMTWTITATAYVLAPSTQSSASAASSGTQTAGAGAAGTSTATPAVVRANG